MKGDPLAKKDENPSLAKRVKIWAWVKYNQLFGWSTLGDSETLEDGVKLHTLPHELQLYLMQYLSGRDLGNMSLVCKETAQIASDDKLWKNLVLTSGMPLLWARDAKLPLKEKIRLFRNECRKVSEKYPKEIIDIFGDAQSLAALPVLEGEWFIFDKMPQTHDLEGHKIMRGFAYNSCEGEKIINQPFIACCVKLKKENMIDQSVAQKLDVFFIFFVLNCTNTIYIPIAVDF